MFRIYIIMLISLFFSFSVISQDMTGRFMLIDKSEKTFLPGDTFKGIIQIMPHNGVNLERYQGMKGKDFLDFFYTLDVDKIALNENNSDVLEIFGTFIIKGYFKPEPFYIWSFNSENLPITLVGINVINDESKGEKQFSLIEQDYNSFFTMNWLLLSIILLILAISLIVLLPIYHRRRLKQRRLKTYQDKKKFWNDFFDQCEKRTDYEYVMKNRNEWIDLVNKENHSITDFFACLDKYQYKPEWDDVELSAVKSSFEKIKNIFGEK